MRKSINHFLSLTILAIVLVMSGCSAKALKNSDKKNNKNKLNSQYKNQLQTSVVDSDMIKEKVLDTYSPKKREYRSQVGSGLPRTPCHTHKNRRRPASPYTSSM